MNLKFLVLVPFFLFFIDGNAQRRKSSFSTGLNIGIGQSYLNGQPSMEDQTPNIAFTLEVPLQFKISKNFSLTIPISYERKGSQSTLHLDLGNNEPAKMFELRADYHYLTIPLLARFHLGRKTKFFVNVGPYYSILLENNITNNFNGQGFGNVSYGSNKNENYDYGATWGLGIQEDLGKHLFLNVELRNNIGLFDTSRDTYNPITPMEMVVKQFSIYLQAGILYKFGR